MRAITLAVNMRSEQQIGKFSQEVDSALERVKERLPEDLVIARTSDQPRQVHESVSLFMHSLYEAVILVVMVALVGFWEWRSAFLMALSIPITMAMTFGMMHFLHIDLQQVSIASLVIALGLLVDDPVVANDAIKQELDHGKARDVASWLGPTKLARAILYATITNIVAYLPYLLLTGDTGRFLYTLPIVLTCSLVASRVVSMTFVPFIGYYVLVPHKKPARSAEELRTTGFYGMYYRLGSFLIDNRWKAFLDFAGAGGRGLLGTVAAQTAILSQRPLVPLLRGPVAPGRRIHHVHGRRSQSRGGIAPRGCCGFRSQAPGQERQARWTCSSV